MKILPPCAILAVSAISLTTSIHAESAAPAPTRASKPNIILCMTDDQAWGDVSYNGLKAIVAEALKFIEKNAGQDTPFFACIWFGSPHIPLKPTAEDIKAAGGSPYYGEILGVDRSMGALRAGLRKLGIADNTMLWFNSDNGAWRDPKAAPDTNGSNGDLRGSKGELWEGGIRVPGLLEWPAHIKQPAVTSVPVVTSDIYPTIVDLLRIKLPNQNLPLDGITLMPLIDGQMKERPQPIGFWYHGGPAALTDNRYKLHKLPSDKYGLYDISTDKSEKSEIADQHPEIVARMKAELETWQQSVSHSNRGEDYPEKKVLEPAIPETK